MMGTLLNLLTKYYICLLLFIFAATTQQIDAQLVSDSVYIHGDVFPIYYYHGNIIKVKDLGSILQQYPPAFNTFQNSNKYNYINKALLIGSGLFLGLTVHEMVDKENYNWVYGGMGLGMITISIPISIKQRDLKKQAISQYNSNL